MTARPGDVSRRGVIAGVGVAACSQAGAPAPPPPPAQTFPRPVFPLATAGGARHLVDAAGAPFMLHGDTGWSLIADLSREDALLYLDDRAARGFNTILVSLLEHKFATNAPANHDHHAPFVIHGDYATPNEAYFAHADWVLEQAEARGLLALVTPSYVGWVGGDEGWYAAMVANGTEKLRGYGRFVARRFAARRNILWVHGGDDDPPDREVVRAIALGIRDVDQRTLHTFHGGVDSSALGYWGGGEDWLAVNTVYTRARIYEACAEAYRRDERMPVFFIEGTYENETYGGPIPEEDGLRREAYHAVLSGAFGHVFGNNPIWHFDGPGLFEAPTDWRGALGSRGAQSMTWMRMLLEEARWHLLAPDLDGAFLVAGAGDGENRAVAAVGSDGGAAVVYLPAARRVSVDLAPMAGPSVRLSWVDPSSGASLLIDAALAPSSGVRQLSPPRRNAAGYRDWVLLAVSV